MIFNKIPVKLNILYIVMRKGELYNIINYEKLLTLMLHGIDLVNNFLTKLIT